MAKTKTVRENVYMHVSKAKGRQVETLFHLIMQKIYSKSIFRSNFSFINLQSALCILKLLNKYKHFLCTGLLSSRKLVHLNGKNFTFLVSAEFSELILNTFQDGGCQKSPPLLFSPVTSTNEGNKCQPQIIELERRAPLKTNGFSGQILIKLRL